MFYSLTGKLIHQEPTMVAISCGGVAFKCSISFNTQKVLPRVGEEVTLFTHLNVREDALDLFGFATNREMDFFKLLTNISGVGPKVGLAILSELTPDAISIAAASGDSKAFARANGVGPKLASRIVLELKDKAGNMLSQVKDESSQNSGVVLNDASANSAKATGALVALGYSPSEAAFAVAKIDSSLKTEEIIRLALKSFAK